VGERRYDIQQNQVIQLQKFVARQILVNNLLPRWLYIRVGGTDIPTAANCDLAIAPMTAVTTPIPDTYTISVGMGPVLVTLGQQVESNKSIVTLYDVPQPGSLGSIDLNPSRLGAMTQRKFVVAGSYTIPFSVSTLHVANYSKAWVYVKFGSLAIPTAATADITLPPMSEKSLTCMPTTLFAFGLSSDLVTTGQQIPAGVNITVTFYEYPTPISIGTADLNPSKMGQMVQQKFVAPASYTLGFLATTVHVSNYSKAWVYVKFGSLVIPTAATADISLPPMSEKSLTCLPNTQFAFGLSADLVTTGQQIPAGVQIIATFFEYPTPVSVGTADLNPSKLGQSVSFRFTDNSVIDPAFPVSQVNISNYLQRWIYATYNQKNLLLNPDMETWVAGLPQSWMPNLGGGGSITQSSAYRGTFGARVTKGPGAANDMLFQDFAVNPGDVRVFSFWYTTNGVNAPTYYVYDLTNSAMIVGPVVLGTPTDYTQVVTIAFTIPVGCLNARVALYEDAALPNGAWAQFDTACVQVATTASNAQIAVPPLSEKSITLPPSDHIDVVVGTRTVMISTSIPVTSAIFTCYEYAVPTNLGVAPLSPGGFRYHELLHLFAAIPSGTLLERDLSNFAMARYTIKSGEIAATTRILYLTIWDFSDGLMMNTACATIPLFRERWASVTFHAGKRILIEYEEAAAQPFTLTDILEAW
jgi:hypothetical protein